MNNLFTTESGNPNTIKKQLVLKWRRVNDAGDGSQAIPRPRHGHRAVALKDKMLVFGGGNEGIVDELHVFDVTRNQWLIPAVRGDTPRGFAAYGMLVNHSKVLIFGGMIEYGRYSNDLYELETKRWEWRQVRARASPNGEFPCARLGHSFTMCNNIAIVFGGLANESDDPKVNIPKYLNDVFIMDLTEPTNTLCWVVPQIHGIPPPPRESHSAVYHCSAQTGKKQLIIYGGMNGARLGDLWILDLYSMTWSNPSPNGTQPLPRSLHTANIVGHRMFVFGGWVPIQPREEKVEQPDKEWKCTNTLAVLNLNTLSWEQPAETVVEEYDPNARAGHSSVVINRRLYIWSGRDGYRKMWNSQVCCDDLFFLEVEQPNSPAAIQLVKASVSSLEVQWTPIPNAELYQIQIQKAGPPISEMDKQARRVVRGPNSLAQQQRGSIRMVRPATGNYRQPTLLVQQRAGAYSVPTRSDQTSQPRTIIVQKSATPGGDTFAQSVKQPDQQYGQSTFEVLPPQGKVKPVESFVSSIESAAEFGAMPATKTTYSVPSAPAVDQTMPHNILDEALNEAESFVASVAPGEEQRPEEAQPEVTNGKMMSEEATESANECEGVEEKAEKLENEKVENEGGENVEKTGGGDIKESKVEVKQMEENTEQPERQEEESAPKVGDAAASTRQNEPQMVGKLESPQTPPGEPGNPSEDALPPAHGEEQLVQAETANSAIDQWCDVATVPGSANRFVVSQYHLPVENPNEAAELAPKAVSLESGVAYRFRVKAINSVGESNWSQVTSFKTCIPGFPGAPSSIKISKGLDGAHISWEPPNAPNGRINEYAVYLAMFSQHGQSNFVPVYAGPQPFCIVNHAQLEMAHIDDLTAKPAIIFRIAARNEKGYGPATQVRWLQEQRNQPVAAVMPPLIPNPSPPAQYQPQQHQMASSAGASAKRAYHYSPPTNQQSTAAVSTRYYASPTSTSTFSSPASNTPPSQIHPVAMTLPSPGQKQRPVAHRYVPIEAQTEGDIPHPPQVQSNISGMSVREYLQSHHSPSKRVRLE